MLSPKKVRFKKQRKDKGRLNEIKGKKNLCHKATSGTVVDTGEYGIKALEPGRITAAQLEAARKAMIRKMKKIGKCRLRVFPDIPVTNKPISVRMGKGKGSVAYWAISIDAGKILFELDGISKEVAVGVAHAANAKLPIATKMVVNKD